MYELDLEERRWPQAFVSSVVAVMYTPESALELVLLLMGTLTLITMIT